MKKDTKSNLAGTNESSKTSFTDLVSENSLTEKDKNSNSQTAQSLDGNFSTDSDLRFSIDNKFDDLFDEFYTADKKTIILQRS